MAEEPRDLTIETDPLEAALVRLKPIEEALNRYSDEMTEEAKGALLEEIVTQFSEMMKGSGLGTILQLKIDIQTLVNMLTVIVQRNAGEIRLRLAEFAELKDLKFTSKKSDDGEWQILSVARIDAASGEEQPSKLVVMGKEPLILPFGR